MRKFQYVFYQLKSFRETNYGWRGWDEAKDKFLIKDYKCVYSSDVEANTEIGALEKLFEQFNCDHPKDFKGCSMSVSDVVLLIENDSAKWYYCDSFGWKKISVR